MRASTVVFAAATLLSRIAGLARESATAAVFGATATLSAFTVANQIPNLLRSFVADSALSAAFVPVFTELREQGEDERAWRVAGALVTLVMLVLGPLCVAAMIAAPWIIEPFLGTENFTAADVELAVDLTRLLLPIVLVMALSGVVVGILNAHDKFGAAALAPVAWNAVILASLALAVFVEEDLRIWAYAVGTLAGTVVQAVLPVPWLSGLGGRLRPRLLLRDPAVRRILLLMLPVTISLGLINVQQIVGSAFAARVPVDAFVSGVDSGAGPAIIDKAFRIYMLPQGIFSVAVSTVFFPVLARHAARGDDAGFRSTVDAGLRHIIILLVPSAVFLAALAEPVTRLLYERAAFDDRQTVAVALVLVGFAGGLVFNGISLLLIRSFFSLRRTWVPTAVSVLTLVVTVVLDLALYRPFGLVGIAAATSIVNVVGVVVMYAVLGRVVPGLDARGTIRTGLVALASSLVAVAAGAVLALAVRWASDAAGLGTGPAGVASLVSLVEVTAAAVGTGAVYLALVRRAGLLGTGSVRELLRPRPAPGVDGGATRDEAS